MLLKWLWTFKFKINCYTNRCSHGVRCQNRCDSSCKHHCNMKKCQWGCAKHSGSCTSSCGIACSCSTCEESCPKSVKCHICKEVSRAIDLIDKLVNWTPLKSRIWFANYWDIFFIIPHVASMFWYIPHCYHKFDFRSVPGLLGFGWWS